MIVKQCLLISLLLGFTTIPAVGQSVAGVSVVSVNNGLVEAYSATELDYTASLYYGTYTEGYLFENRNQIRAGSATGGPIADGYMSAPSISLSEYQLETDHYVLASYAFTDGGGIPQYSNPSGFGFLPSGGGGSFDFGPVGAPIYVVTQSIYLGTTIIAQLDAPADPSTLPAPDEAYLNEGDSFARMSPEQRRVLVRNWDAQIRAAMAAGLAQQQQIPTYRFPVYLTVTQDCGQQGDSLSATWVRHRRYRVYDNFRHPWTDSITIKEIMSDYSGIGDGIWREPEFLDHLSIGGLLPTGQRGSGLQNFFATDIPFVLPTVPLFVLDKQIPYGTLSIVYSDTSVSINGDGNAPGACIPPLD